MGSPSRDSRRGYVPRIDNDADYVARYPLVPSTPKCICKTLHICVTVTNIASAKYTLSLVFMLVNYNFFSPSRLLVDGHWVPNMSRIP